MKIEQLLVQQLYNSKVVSLQGIGTFKLGENVVLPAENEKDFELPADAISFTYDTKAQEDEALIDFIVQQTRKIKPLAAADLDSYIMLSKQFLNIGKPFRIEGVGTLQKNQAGAYDFTPGQYISPKIEAAVKPLKEKFETEPMFSNKKVVTENSGNTKKWLLITAMALVLGLGGWAAWYMLNKNGGGTTIADKITEKESDTTKTKAGQPVTSDTTAVSVRPDSNQMLNPAPAAGKDYTFKVVFFNTRDKFAATKKMNALISRGHKIDMTTTDSVTYTLAEKFTLPLSDTAHVKDSVTRFYYPGSKTYIQQ